MSTEDMPVQSPEDGPPPEAVQQDAGAGAQAPDRADVQREQQGQSDAEIAAALDAQTISLPDGDKMVPLSALQEARRQLSQIKRQGGSAEDVEQLRAQMQALEQRYQEAAPLAEAFRALKDTAARMQPAAHTHAQAAAEPDPDLEAIAKDFDFYKPDGSPDLDRAKRVRERTRREAEAIAQQHVAPIQQQTLIHRAASNVAKAKATTHPVTKQAVDPGVIDRMVQSIAAQPGGLETLANEEAVKQLWLNAYALYSLTATAGHGQPVQPMPAAQAMPVITERSGGRQADQVPALSANEKKAAQAAGLSEKDYLELAKGMPAGWGAR